MINKFEHIKVFSDCFCIDSSISAILVHVPGHGNLWFPDKEIFIESEIKGIGDRGKLIISEWLAKEKRLMR